jgi:Holliday junction resolvase
MRQAAKIDANQNEIVTALRAKGFAVLSLAALGKGVPDLLVASKDKLTLLEVKKPEGKLTMDQIAWHAAWPRLVYIVHNSAEALQAVM